MTVDPRWSFWLSIILAVLGVLGGASAQFTDLGLAAPVVKAILAAVVLLLGVGNAVNAILSAMPASRNVGPNEAGKFYLGPKP